MERFLDRVSLAVEALLITLTTAVMSSELLAETAQLVTDYLQYHLGGLALPPNPLAKTLWRVAAELESREKMLFHLICNSAAFLKPCKVAAHLSRVAAQLEADGGLNWGRVMALFVFTAKLAAMLAQWGTHEEINALAEALVTYLARESVAGGAGRLGRVLSLLQQA
ncbi:UNVERIFIED_CONTAM: hypothetical protein K2H54_020425 [Gekko kuhli]